jgi:aminomethyltransferase
VYGEDRVHFLERFLVGDIASLTNGQCKLSLILNKNAGIEDDVVFANHDSYLNVVLNAGNKHEDFHAAQQILENDFKGKNVALEYVEDESLISLQGPKAKDIVSDLIGQNLDTMLFMSCGKFKADKFDTEIIVSRCGYTGEDGFELSIKDDKIESLCEYLFDKFEDILTPSGLGARDLLRLEAGMNLHGHDIDASINPVEALLMWTVRKKSVFTPFVGQKRLKEIRKVKREKPLTNRKE